MPSGRSQPAPGPGPGRRSDAVQPPRHHGADLRRERPARGRAPGPVVGELLVVVEACAGGLALPVCRQLELQAVRPRAVRVGLRESSVQLGGGLAPPRTPRCTSSRARRDPVAQYIATDVSHPVRVAKVSLRWGGRPWHAVENAAQAAPRSRLQRSSTPWSRRVGDFSTVPSGSWSTLRPVPVRAQQELLQEHPELRRGGPQPLPVLLRQVRERAAHRLAAGGHLATSPPRPPRHRRQLLQVGELPPALHEPVHPAAGDLAGGEQQGEPVPLRPRRAGLRPQLGAHGVDPVPRWFAGLGQLLPDLRQGGRLFAFSHPRRRPRAKFGLSLRCLPCPREEETQVVCSFFFRV